MSDLTLLFSSADVTDRLQVAKTTFEIRPHEQHNEKFYVEDLTERKKGYIRPPHRLLLQRAGPQA